MELKTDTTPEDTESIFIEISQIKTMWLFCDCYHTPKNIDNAR